MPKISSSVEHGIVEKLRVRKRRLATYYERTGKNRVYYTRKVGYFLQILDFVPRLLDSNGRVRPPSELKELRFSSAGHARLALAALNSNLFYWFVTVFSDCRNLNRREMDGFPISLDELEESPVSPYLIEAASDLMADLAAKSEMREMRAGGTLLTVQCFFPRRSKPLIDRLDDLLADYFTFSAEEADFIRNYEIKYRLGEEALALS